MINLIILVLILFTWIIILQFRVSSLSESLVYLREKLEFLNRKVASLNKVEAKPFVPQEEEVIVEPKINEDTFDEYIVLDEEELELEEELEEIKPAVKTIKQNLNNTQIKETSLESLLLGNIFNIIGAIAIIIGCGIFIKLISPFIIFTPLMKTLIGILIGTSMVSAGSSMKKDNLKLFSEILIGTGFSILFIIIYCSHIVFHTFSLSLTVLLGVITLIASYYMADKQKTISMIAVSLIGGYLNVILLLSMADSLNKVFGYLVFLNLLSILFVCKNPNKSQINIINLITTAFFVLFINLVKHFPYDFFSNLGNIKVEHWSYLLVLWGLYFAFDVINRHKSDKYDVNGVLNWANFFTTVICGFTVSIEYKPIVGFVLMFISIIYGFTSYLYIIKNSDKFKVYLNSMLMGILFTVYLLVESLLIRNVIWSLIGIIIGFIAYKYEKLYLAKWCLFYLTCSIVGIFFVPEVLYFARDLKYTPILNDRFYAFISPIVGSFLTYHFISKLSDNQFKNIAQWLKISGITLLYLFGMFELNEFINEKASTKVISPWFIKCMSYSIIGFIYTLQMKRYEKIINKEYLGYISGTIGIISLSLLLLTCWVYHPIKSFIPIINIRFIAFLFAIAVSLFYAKSTKSPVFKYFAIALGFILITIEGYSCIAKYHMANSYIISILWLLYTAVITMFGIFKNNEVLKYSGISISVLAVLKIFLLDLAKVDMIYKLFVFLALGAIFMLISYYYNEKKK